MKSCTDIKQSKKLAEILPTKSADAFYDMAEPEKRQVPIIGDPDDYYDMEDWTIPCWSLAALLELLPNEIGRYTKTLYWYDDAWHCAYVDEDSECMCDQSNDISPIDACIEMILKLHEQKLI